LLITAVPLLQLPPVCIGSRRASLQIFADYLQNIGGEPEV